MGNKEKRCWSSSGNSNDRKKKVVELFFVFTARISGSNQSDYMVMNPWSTDFEALNLILTSIMTNDVVAYSSTLRFVCLVVALLEVFNYNRKHSDKLENTGNFRGVNKLPKI